ncbi:MAG: Bax inhibitor-1/YccA family protein [Bifidobacteriaceae bacterium]|jgi:uncharacterized YccA/Bax inhibitor family protein|nr:Bax inhibitor-1/YccA family protein [Bifidobacteriaceae bacterium]
MANPMLTTSAIFNGGVPGFYASFSGPRPWPTIHLEFSRNLVKPYPPGPGHAQPTVNSITTPRITYDGTLIRSAAMFALLLVATCVGWELAPIHPALSYACVYLVWVLLYIALRQHTPRPPLVVATIATEGLMLGATCVAWTSADLGGTPLQALIAALAVTAATLVCFASVKIRAWPKSAQVSAVAFGGCVLYCVTNLLGARFGLATSPFGAGESFELFGVPPAMVLGVAGVFVGAYALVGDFAAVKLGSESGAPALYSWWAVLVLFVEVIFVYLVLLELLLLVVEAISQRAARRR